jgi:hypothetical protein
MQKKYTIRGVPNPRTFLSVGPRLRKTEKYHERRGDAGRPLSVRYVKDG